jgi:hypothetical protein
MNVLAGFKWKRCMYGSVLCGVAASVARNGFDVSGPPFWIFLGLLALAWDFLVMARP